MLVRTGKHSLHAQLILQQILWLPNVHDQEGSSTSMPICLGARNPLLMELVHTSNQETLVCFYHGLH